jgi:hypothetical protein
LRQAVSCATFSTPSRRPEHLRGDALRQLFEVAHVADAHHFAGPHHLGVADDLTVDGRRSEQSDDERDRGDEVVVPGPAPHRPAAGETSSTMPVRDGNWRSAGNDTCSAWSTGVRRTSDAPTHRQSGRQRDLTAPDWTR